MEELEVNFIECHFPEQLANLFRELADLRRSDTCCFRMVPLDYNGD